MDKKHILIHYGLCNISHDRGNIKIAPFNNTYNESNPKCNF
jgi:hypothetical protein